MTTIHNNQRRYDPYTGAELESAPWMLNPPGLRMPYAAGRTCTTPSCAKPLSRYDPGPACWSCYQKAQAKAAAEARLQAAINDEAAA